MNDSTRQFVPRTIARWSRQGALTRSKKTRLFCKDCGVLQRVTGNDQNIATLDCGHERNLFNQQVVDAFTQMGAA
jgi:hypothetical protein